MRPRPDHVRLEHHAPGRLGIGERAPRLSWVVPAAPPGWVQTGAEVEVHVTDALGATGRTVHRLAGDAQVLVPWPAAPLRARDHVAVRVRVQGGVGAATDGAAAPAWGPWSGPVEAEVGLVDPGCWLASFVGPVPEAAPGPGPDGVRTERRPARVRHGFVLDAEPVRARLHLSGHGLVEAEVNGRRAGDEELTPGWTSYSHRLRWATFDVTGHVRAGANVIGVWLADGWWRGRVGFEGGRTDLWGTDQAALAQLEVLTADGRLVVVASDPTWQVGEGPTLQAGLYDGERVDLRLHDPAWSTPAGLGATHGWGPVHTTDLDPGVLVAPTGPPVRCTEQLLPVQVRHHHDGRWLLDFGRNHTGRLRLRVDGPAGTRITVRHAEVLQDGELCTRPLRGAAATDEVVLPGGPVRWEPRATVHGYRYAEVAGWPGDLHEGDVVSRVLHTDMARLGTFTCDDPDLQRLHDNVVTSLRSNFVDLPTDCPQRDERLGWTGDLQVFAPAAAHLYDVTGMLASWLQDVAAEQGEHGAVPFYVPFMALGYFGEEIPPAAVWGDVTTLVPDVLHLATADTDLLRRQFASGRAWVDLVETTAGPDRIADKCFQFGDWLDPAAPPDRPWQATTPPELVATAYFAHSARRLAATARTLGETTAAAGYEALAADVTRAYQARFVPEGRMRPATQTALALTTVFDLWPDAASREAGARLLAQLVADAGYTVATGFAGTPALAEALARGGHLDTAYRLVQSHRSPSWLSMVDRGATSMWERWDSLLPDGTVNPGDMTSFNHYALGAVADWLHRVVGGLAPLEPGYRRWRAAPRPGGTLRRAGATHRTPYGAASVTWQLDGPTLRVQLQVPVGTHAELDLPGAPAELLGHGRHERVVPWPPRRDVPRRA